MRPFSILLACPTRGPFDLDSEHLDRIGGIETCNVELARALAALGHDVTLATPTLRTISRDGVRNVPLAGLTGTWDAAVASNDVRVLPRGAAMAVVWLHNPMPVEKALRRGQLPGYVGLRPHAVFPSRDLRMRTVALYPFRSRTVIPHGIGADFHGPLRAGVRSPVFVFASQPQRGLDLVLRVWTSRIRPRAPEASLHVYGSVADNCPQDAAALDAAGIRLFGRRGRAELVEAYDRATAMICPGAADETFCLAAVEAQARGLPVVTLGRGCLAERVRDGVDGFVAASETDLADRAIALLRSPALAASLRDGARRTAGSYTWRRAALLWDDMLARAG